MTLKTLKDIETWSKGEHPLISIVDLKREAIKWHEEFKKMKRKITIEDWELFFNITDEDLK